MTQVRFHSLTIARGFVAWWVAVYHAREWLPLEPGSALAGLLHHGYLGVDFFFILSGFVIHLGFGRYFQSGQLSGWGPLIRFVQARYARIFPVHLVVLFSMWVNVVALRFFSSSGAVSEYYSVPYFIASVFLVQAWWPGVGLGWNGPAWSVSCEHLVYLIYGVLMMFGGRYHLRLGPIAPILLLTSSWFVLGAVYAINDLPSIGAGLEQLGVIRCLLGFVGGACLSSLYAGRGGGLTWRIGAVLIAAAAGLALGQGIPNYWAAPALFGALIMLMVDFEKASGGAGRASPFVYLGLISYSTYIVHFPIKLLFILGDLPMRIGAEGAFAAYCISVLAASALLFEFVEKPAQAFFTRLRPLAPIDRGRLDLDAR